METAYLSTALILYSDKRYIAVICYSRSTIAKTEKLSKYLKMTKFEFWSVGFVYSS